MGMADDFMMIKAEPADGKSCKGSWGYKNGQHGSSRRISLRSQIEIKLKHWIFMPAGPLLAFSPCGESKECSINSVHPSVNMIS